MIDLVLLRALTAVRDHGSVVAASDVLGCTPSAVSQQLKRLERQSGAVVVERYGRGVLLTEAGHRLAARGADLLASMEALEADVAAGRGTVGGRVRMAAFSTAVRGVVAPLLRRLADDDAGIALEVVEEDPPGAVDLVASGRVDLALIHHWGEMRPASPAHLEREVIGLDVADVLVPVGHPLAQRARVSPQALRDDVFACAPVGSVCHQWLTRLFQETGGPPRIAYWVGEFSSHIALVEHGAAVSLIPRLGREAIPVGVVVLPVEPPVTRTVSVTWRRSMDASPTVTHLRRLLVDSAPAWGLLPPPGRSPG
ncbi:MAG: LysR family transcriptional regulator [Actinomycetota bacterium]|nr:LysR family transcriptional regulator [Actinomycetota bacterium]